MRKYKFCIIEFNDIKEFCKGSFSPSWITKEQLEDIIIKKECFDDKSPFHAKEKILSKMHGDTLIHMEEEYSFGKLSKDSRVKIQFAPVKPPESIIVNTKFKAVDIGKHYVAVVNYSDTAMPRIWFFYKVKDILNFLQIRKQE